MTRLGGSVRWRDASGWTALVGVREAPAPGPGVRHGPAAPDGSRLVLTTEGDPPELSVAVDASATVVLEGRLYERDRLERHLGGPEMLGLTPAELVLQLWRRQGDEAIDELRGYFALVLHDAASGTVLAARDPHGTQPLYWARCGGGHAFSTDLDRLVVLPGVAGEPSAEILAIFVMNRYPRRDETFLTDVYRVPEGNRTRFDGDGPRHHRFWSPRVPSSEREWIRDGAVEGFDEVFSRTLRNAMFGRAGVYLSGGLDSVTVAAFAADESRAADLQSPIGLSILFPGPHSEESVQRAVAGELGIPHATLGLYEAMSPAGGGLIEGCMAWAASLPLPVQNFWLPGYASLNRVAAERGVEVVFTGGGGDEWLTVDPLYGADLLARLRLPAFIRHARLLRRSYGLPLLSFLRSVSWRFGLRPNLVSLLGMGLGASGVARAAVDRLSLRRWAARIPDWAAPDPRVRERALERVEERFRERRWPRPGHWYMRMLRHEPHPSVALGYEEIYATGRRTGVRVLEPYWDRDVIDFLACVHPEVLNAGGWTKALVRRSLERRFPGLGFRTQQKLLSGNLFTDLVVAEAPGLLDRCGDLRLAQMGVVDAAAVRSFVDDVRERRSLVTANRLWHVLNLEAWVRGRTEAWTGFESGTAVAGRCMEV